MKKVLIGAIVGACIASLAAFGIKATQTLPKAYDNVDFPCSQKGMNQAELDACSEVDFEKADQELAAVYGSFVSFSDDLSKSQKAFTKYRDSECQFSTDYVLGEPMQKTVLEQCKTLLTEARIKTLKKDRRNLRGPERP